MRREASGGVGEKRGPPIGVDPDYVVDLLKRAVATPSITGNEAAVARLFAHELEAIGLDRVELFDFEPGRPNVVGVLDGSSQGQTTMLAGHLDTVHVEGWEDRWRGTERESPFCAAVVDGELWGRGAADMKAGVVAAVAAAKAIRDAGVRPRADLVLALVGDEESGQPNSGLSDGMKAVVGRIERAEIPKPDFAVYAEPTALDVHSAQMGFFIARITVLGRGAYFGKPWLGVDAIRGAHELLSELWAYNEGLWDKAHHELLGHPFLLVTEIHGGGYIAVPERCRIDLIRKLLPSETLNEAARELEDLLEKLAIRRGIRTEITYTAARDHRLGGTPVETSAELPPVRALRDALRAVTGKPDVVSGAPYWSEISFLSRLGVPSVYFGPGDIGLCHTVEERVPVAEVVAAAEVFTRFIENYSGLNDPARAGSVSKGERC